MDKFLRPDRFSTPPTDANGSGQWVHWKKTFDNFISKYPLQTDQTVVPDGDKLLLLTNYISADLYSHIANATTYDAAVTILQGMYIKPVNRLFARHDLANRQQQSGQSLDEFLQDLNLLAEKCNFTDVTA